MSIFEKPFKLGFKGGLLQNLADPGSMLFGGAGVSNSLGQRRDGTKGGLWGDKASIVDWFGSPITAGTDSQGAARAAALIYGAAAGAGAAGAGGAGGGAAGGAGAAGATGAEAGAAGGAAAGSGTAIGSGMTVDAYGNVIGAGTAGGGAAGAGGAGGAGAVGDSGWVDQPGGAMDMGGSGGAQNYSSASPTFSWKKFASNQLGNASNQANQGRPAMQWNTFDDDAQKQYLLQLAQALRGGNAY